MVYNLSAVQIPTLPVVGLTRHGVVHELVPASVHERHYPGAEREKQAEGDDGETQAVLGDEWSVYVGGELLEEEGEEYVAGDTHRQQRHYT